jgi:hypothetical protein
MGLRIAQSTKEISIATSDHMKIEGPFSKPYELWRMNSKREKIERLPSEDTIEESRKVRRRADWFYEIYHNGRRLGKLAK